MIQALSTVSRSTSGSLPVAASRPLLDLVSRFTNRLEEIPGDVRRYALPKAAEPSEAQRAAMQGRRQELQASLVPDLDERGEPSKATRLVISSLLFAFPAFGEQQAASSGLEAMYTRAVRGLPLWAIQDAASRFVEGRARIAWTGDRCPTPPQLVSECRIAMRVVEDELVRLTHVLDAEVYEVTMTADERTRLDAALKEATSASDMRKANRQQFMSRNEVPEDALARLAHEGLGGKLLSDEALRLVGVERRAKEGETA